MNIAKPGRKTLVIGFVAALALGVLAVSAQALQFDLRNAFSGNGLAGDVSWTTSVLSSKPGTPNQALTESSSSGTFITEWNSSMASTCSSSPSVSLATCTTCDTGSALQPISSDVYQGHSDGTSDISLQFGASGSANSGFDGTNVAVITSACAGCSGFDSNAFDVLDTAAAGAGPIYTGPDMEGIPVGTGSATCRGEGSDTVERSTNGNTAGACESSTPVPEPMTVFLGGTGLLIFAYAGRKRLFTRFGA